jgi:hypothetical protein
MIEEEEFKSILSIAQRLIDIYGRPEAADSSRIIYIDGDLNIGRESGVVDIIFRGSLVFRHDPKGETTDFFEQHGIWIDEIERVSRNIPQSYSDLTNKGQ